MADYKNLRVHADTYGQLQELAVEGQSMDGVIRCLIRVNAEQKEMIATYANDTPQMGDGE